MAKAQINFDSLGGGGKTYMGTATTKSDSLTTPISVGFQPTVVIVTTPNYVYTFNSNYDNNTYICPLTAFDTGKTAGFGTSNIVRTSDGFDFTVATGGDKGKSITVFCADA